MSTRPRPPQPEPPRVESELDTTAELPVLDAAAAPAAEAAADGDAHGSTGTWIMPPEARAGVAALTRAAEGAHADAELPALRARVADLQALLAGKDERLAQVERARDEALAARAAADERVASLTQELSEQQARVANLTEQLGEQHTRAGALSAQLGEQQARGNTVNTQLTAEQARVATLTEQLSEQQARTVALSAQLAEQQARVAQHAAQLQEAVRARAAAEQRVAQLGEELGQARAQASAAAERESQLRGTLDEQQRLSREQLARELKEREAQEARGRARTADVMGELHVERSRTVSYLESLQTTEARRLIMQELVVDLQREADAHETELAHLRGELSGRDSDATETSAELAQRAARIARLEQQLATFSEALAQRDGQLRDARQEAQNLQLGFTRLQGELSASGERIRAFEAQAEQHAAADARARAELQRLQSEHAAHTSELESARAAAAAHTTQAAAQEATLASGRERIAQLEAALEAERQRAAKLESELERVRTEMEDWGSALQSAQQEREGRLAALAAAEARARELEHRAGGHTEEIRSLQSEAESSAARVRELEADLRAAEDTVHRLESEVRSRSARVEELEKSNQQWRTLEEARHGSADSAANAALREAARPHAEAAAAQENTPLPDGATRLLIQSEGGREIVHVLGRKTSIGRTPDNDVQIDAKFVSRHHAVILAGPAQTIIEDLNSTNGVQVNGRRVSRLTLRDGDQVAIGRTVYRFAVRKAPEKR